MKRTVCLSIDTANDAEFVEAFERLARMVAGEILSGRTARVYSIDDDEEEEES
jgi:hypothetical protein